MSYIPKIPQKYSHLISAALMPFIISLVVAFIKTTALNGLPLTITFIYSWLWSWAKAYVLALPVSLASAPFIKKLICRITG